MIVIYMSSSDADVVNYCIKLDIVSVIAIVQLCPFYFITNQIRKHKLKNVTVKIYLSKYFQLICELYSFFTNITKCNY